MLKYMLLSTLSLIVAASAAKAATPVVCKLTKISSTSAVLREWTIDPRAGDFKVDETIASDDLTVSMSGNVRSFAVFQLRKDGYASSGSVARQPKSLFDADLSITTPDSNVYNLQCRGDR